MTVSKSDSWIISKADEDRAHNTGGTDCGSNQVAKEIPYCL